MRANGFMDDGLWLYSEGVAFLDLRRSNIEDPLQRGPVHTLSLLPITK